MIASTIFKIVYGIDIENMDDPHAKLAEMSMEGLAVAVVPGAYWVEYFPFLRHIPSWLPGAKFQQIIKKYKPFVEGLVEKPYAEVLRAMVSYSILRYRITIFTSPPLKGKGTADPSVARSMVLKSRGEAIGGEKAFPEDVYKGVLAVTYGGTIIISVLVSGVLNRALVR